MGEQLRQEILEAKVTDNKVFHKLFNKQRENRRCCVIELLANKQIVTS